jgi:hypothetical protein
LKRVHNAEKLAAVVKMHLAEKRKANSLDELNASRFDLRILSDKNCEHSSKDFRFAAALCLG